MTENQIVLFPKVKERLLQQLELAISGQDHEDVVKIADELLQHSYTEKHVFISKINAFIKLKRWDEAEDFCEYAMEQSESYESILMSYYLFILHENHQYAELIKSYEDAMLKETIATDDDALIELYESAKYLLESEYRQQKRYLERAIEEGNHLRQAQILANLKLNGYEDIRSIYKLLTDISIHPVVKTEILQWASELKLQDEIEVEKFGQVMTVVPSQLDDIEEQHSYQMVLTRLNHVQQQNPVQYEWLVQLFYHYGFVIFPMLIPEAEVTSIVKALEHVIENEFNSGNEIVELEQNVKRYTEEIKICHEMYLQIFSSD